MKKFTVDNVHAQKNFVFESYAKKRLTMARKVEGPFKVETREGTLQCRNGYLALDSEGYPYPIAAEEFEKIYEPAVLEESNEPKKNKTCEATRTNEIFSGCPLSEIVRLNIRQAELVDALLLAIKTISNIAPQLLTITEKNVIEKGQEAINHACGPQNWEDSWDNIRKNLERYLERKK